MEPLNVPLKAFLDDLAARQPTPGGGSASALGGALGAALGGMAALYTTGNPKFKDVEAKAFEIDGRFRDCRAALQDLIQRDMDAYGSYVAARALPKETPEQKDARKTALAAATEQATRVPEEIVRWAKLGLDAVEDLAHVANPAMAGDVAAAAYFLEAAARGGAIQVLSNCSATDKEGMNAQRRDRVLAIVAACEAARIRIHSAAVSMM